MKQKLQDIVLLIKHDRKWQVVTILLAFMIAYSFVASDGKKRRTAKKDKNVVQTGALSPDEGLQDAIDFFNTATNRIEKKLDSQNEKIADIAEKQSEFEERTAEIFQRLIQRVTLIEDSAGAINNYNTTTPLSDPELPGDTLTSFGDVSSVEEVAPPEEEIREKIAFVGKGDSVQVKLISGVNAPTDGTPYPVVFKLLSDVFGPDGSALPLGEARLVAAAQGSLTDSRALFRLTSLNVRLPDGSRKVIDVDGWVVGEDGLRGMEGILVDPIGKVLGGAAVAGFTEGFGNAISASATRRTQNVFGITTETVDNAYEYGVGRGVGEVGDEWSDYIKDRADQMVPHVKILSGRNVTAVFSQNVMIEDLLDNYDEPEAVFVSLD